MVGTVLAGVASAAVAVATAASATMPFDPDGFSRDWVAAWNRADAEWVLARFADDAEFVSPLAARVTGQPDIHGKLALRDYWQRALRARSAPPKFELTTCVWDSRASACLIVYVSTEPDGSRHSKAELFHFGADGLIKRGEAFGGAVMLPRG